MRKREPSPPWDRPISCAVPLSLSKLHNTASEAAAFLRHTPGKGRKASDRGSFKRRRASKKFFGATWRRIRQVLHQCLPACSSLILCQSRDRKAHPESPQMPLKLFIFLPLYNNLMNSLSCHHVLRDISHVIGFSQRRESIDGS